MSIKLNFINRSNDTNGSQVVIFQKNVSTDASELAVAWTVIQHCGQGCNHPFVFPMDITVSASDSYGNYTPQLKAQNGELFQMTRTSSSDQLVPAGSGTSPREVQVLNGLPMGAINAYCFRDRRVVATKTSIAPQQKAVFEFTPTLWIGVASEVEEGALMNSAIISSINTEISLLGIASADIVMTGGGSGAEAKPFAFELQNVVTA